FRMLSYGSISGRITDDQNEPVRWANVTLFPRAADPDADRWADLPPELSEGMLRSARTDDRGMYYFRDLRPGQYAVAVQALPWYARNDIGTRTAPGSSTPENASAGPQSDEAQSALDVAYPFTFYPDTDDPDRAEIIDVSAGAKTIADIALHAVPRS